MNLKTKLLVLLGLVTVGVMAQAQQSDQKQLNLSLQEAQNYALEHNRTLKNATLDVRKAEAAKWETFSTMLPQVNAGFDYSNMCGYKMNFGAMSVPMNPSGSLSVTAAVALSAQQVMGSLMNGIAVEMSDLSRQQTEQSTLLDVKNVYVSILVMEDIVKLLDSSLVNVEKLQKTTIDAVRVGASEAIDVDKLAVQVATLKSNIKSNERSLKLLYNSMLLQLGADVNTQLHLTTPLNKILNVDEVAQMTMKPFNVENNYSYQLLQKNEQLSKQQLMLSWLGFAPTLSVFYQYSYKTYFGKSEGLNMTPPNMVGAQISWPLFKSGGRLANVKQAQINLQETINNKEQAVDGLEVQYNQLCYDLVSALETYDIQKENLDVTRRVFENVSKKYQYGRASSLEVTTASNDIISAQSTYIQAVMSLLSAQSSLENLLCEKQSK